MSLNPFLVEILVDPEDKEPLWYFADEDVLYNPRLKRRYAVREGIPILLINEAESVDATEAERFEARAADAIVTGTGPSSEPQGG